MPRAPAKTVISRLASYGLSPMTIATIFDIDDLPVDVAVRDDDDLRVGVRRVAWRVIEETLLMLDEGSPVVKQRMITNLFAKMMGMLAEESGEDLSTLRLEMTEMVSAMKINPVKPDDDQGEVEADAPE